MELRVQRELEGQVTLYTQCLDKLHSLYLQMAERARFIVERECFIEETPAAENLSLLRGVVAQAELQQQHDRTEGEALMREIGEVYWKLLCNPQFRAGYQQTVLRVPHALKLAGEDIDLWNWERRLLPSG